MRPTRTAFLLVGGLLLSLVSSLSFGASSAQTPAATPRIVIAEPLFGFTDVVDGTEIVHDFKVQNKGAGVLEIEKVRTS